ncbi:MAG: hypothetical protein J7K46_09590 [Bacteroidales bacterium]|nr:hypothetical protein [Bacteroidales bacterium]
MKTKRLFTLLSLALIAVVISLSGCKNRNQNNKTSNTIKQAYKTRIKKEVQSFIYPLPTSYQVIQMLKDIGISYIIGISNPPDRVNQYLSLKSKALALGIYGADLSYASIYNMRQDILNYLDVIKKLGDDLDLKSVYNENIFKRINDNIDNKDTLVNIMTNALFDSYNQLNKSDNGNLALLMVAGSWIEALYLTTHVSGNAYNNYKLVKIIFDQKESLTKLMNVLEEYKDNQDIGDLINILTPLQQKYNAIQGSMTEKQLQEISTEVEKVRKKLIE